jgi:hypothetical protein
MGKQSKRDAETASHHSYAETAQYHSYGEDAAAPIGGDAGRLARAVVDRQLA